MKIIEVTNLHKKIGERIIFEKVNFAIYENSLNFLIGPSGSGKTTFFNILIGIDQNYSGTVKINGKTKLNIFKENKYLKEDMTIIFQNYALINDWTVKQNLEITNKTIDEAMLKELQIESLLKTKICELSGGEQQRVAIARSILLDTKILLCDEPTGNLDYKSAEIVMNIFERLITKYHKTILIITHSKKYLNDNTWKIVDKKIIKVEK
ncbi:MAG: ABC transporter ATP-binding protein [Mycoplasmatales bacterium]